MCVDSAGAGRMSIQRLASALITSHCPALANPLLGSIHTYVLSSVVFSAREYDCAYSKYVCMYMHMHTYVHACVNFSQIIKDHYNILILGIVHL